MPRISSRLPSTFKYQPELPPTIHPQSIHNPPTIRPNFSRTTEHFFRQEPVDSPPPRAIRTKTNPSFCHNLKLRMRSADGDLLVPFWIRASNNHNIMGHASPKRFSRSWPRSLFSSGSRLPPSLRVPSELRVFVRSSKAECTRASVCVCVNIVHCAMEWR